MYGRTQDEKDAKLAQKLGQLQPFIAAFPQECIWGNLHLLGQPNTFFSLAQARAHRRERYGGPRGGRWRAADHPGGRSHGRSSHPDATASYI